MSTRQSVAIALGLFLVCGWMQPCEAHAGHSHGSGDDGGDHMEGAGTLSAFKLWCLALVFGVAMLGGLLAFRLRTFEHRDLAMDLGNSMAGGVFLAAGLLHMLPEASESLEAAFPHVRFPLGPGLCLVGILLPLYVERVLMVDPAGSHGDLEGVDAGTTVVAGGGRHHGHSHSRGLLQLAGSAGHVAGGAGEGDPESGDAEAGMGAARQHTPHHNHNHNHNHNHDHGRGDENTTASGAIVPYLVALLLSIHSLIEGIALGVEDTQSDATMILLAILCHKGLAAFSLGVALTRAEIPARRFMHVMLLFALMTPVGGLMGLIATASVSQSAQSALSDVVTSVASGTFIYVGLVEIILEEFQEASQNKNLKFVSMLVGAAIMSLLSSH